MKNKDMSIDSRGKTSNTVWFIRRQWNSCKNL
jgi:hypothetical protein